MQQEVERAGPTQEPVAHATPHAPQDSPQQLTFHPRSVLGRITLFAAGLVALAGCENKPQGASQERPRPSFSTLVEGKQVSLAEVPAEISDRQELQRSIAEAAGPLQTFVSDYRNDVGGKGGEAGYNWIQSHGAVVSAAREAVAKLDVALESAADNQRLAGAAAQISRLDQTADGFVLALQPEQQHTNWIIASGQHEATGFVQATSLQTAMNDASLALEWDLKVLEPGAAAGRIINLMAQLDEGRTALLALSEGAKHKGSAWFTENEAQWQEARTTIDATLARISEAEKDPFYKTMAEEFGVLRATLQEARGTVADKASVEQHFGAGGEQTGGVMIARVAAKHLGALGADMRDELAAAGVKPQQPPGAPPAGGQQQGGSTPGQPVVVHHDSSNMLLWYMLLRDNGYHNHYYYPGGYGGYSGPGRFYGSTAYRDYATDADGLSQRTGGKYAAKAAEAHQTRVRAEAAAQANAQRSSSPHVTNPSGRGGFGGRPGVSS